MTERKLATIRRIAEIKDIDGADAIEAVRVDGWWVVAKKVRYQVGQLAVYLEVDSWVPNRDLQLLHSLLKLDMNQKSLKV